MLLELKTLRYVKTGIEYNVPDKKMDNPIKVLLLIGDTFDIADAVEEYVILISTDIKNNVINIHEISHGSVNQSVVHPREVIKRVILDNAMGFILVHNHPSGNPIPSNNDKILTSKISQAATTLSVDFHDHIILAGSKFYSFCEEQEPSLY